MKFFFDNNLGLNLVEALRLLDDEIEMEHLREVFDPRTDDDVWLPYVGKNDLLLVTRDKMLIRRLSEVKAYRDFKVGGFYLEGAKSKGLPSFEIVEQIIRNWRCMKEWARKTRRPFFLKVPVAGTHHSFDDMLEGKSRKG